MTRPEAADEHAERQRDIARTPASASAEERLDLSAALVRIAPCSRGDLTYLLTLIAGSGWWLGAGEVAVGRGGREAA